LILLLIYNFVQLGGKLDEIGLWDFGMGTRVMETTGFDAWFKASICNFFIKQFSLTHVTWQI
jgi:hypothetical protein